MRNGVDILSWQVTLQSEFFLDLIATDIPGGTLSKLHKGKNIYCSFWVVNFMHMIICSV